MASSICVCLNYNQHFITLYALDYQSIWENFANSILLIPNPNIEHREDIQQGL